MRADYDSQANAISIDVVPSNRWEHCEGVGGRVNVAIAEGKPVNVELLYPDLGIDEPLHAAAERFGLDAEALTAAAKAALAAPDRTVELSRPAA